MRKPFSEGLCVKTIVSLKTAPRKWVLLHEFGCARNVTLLGLDETKPVSVRLLKCFLLITMVLYLLRSLGLRGSRLLVLTGQRH